MSPEPWRPTASRAALVERARLAAEVRAFFADRGVLEVETPQLSAATVTSVHLHSFECRFHGPGALTGGSRHYLQTSPEFAMKRLLAAGYGPIFQLAKAFRDGEVGRRHNPEFTLLEWYRPGFDHHRLMDEMDALLAATLGSPAAERRSYGELFGTELGVDPHRGRPAALRQVAEQAGVGALPELGEDRDAWLDLLMSLVIEPRLGRGRPTFVYDYPASQAALARLRPGDPPVAERFEVYIEGVELANGFHELTDAAEQRARCEDELAQRRAAGLAEPPLDEHFLAALAAGMPPAAGVALGFDRLVMLKLGATSLDEVLAFPWSRA